MDKKNTHGRIKRQCEKIIFLNNTIADDDVIEAGELELLSNYVADLLKLLNELKPSPSSTEVSVDETLEDTTVFEPADSNNESDTVEVSDEPVVPIEKIEKEIELHETADALYAEPEQRVEAVTETAIEPDDATVSIDDSEQKIEEEAVPEVEEKSSINDRFKDRPSDLASKLSNHRIEDLRLYLDLSQKYEFISQLFKGDVDYFNTALKRFNTAQSFEEAMHFIDTELKNRFDWSAKAEYEKKLLAILKKKFGK